MTTALSVQYDYLTLVAIFASVIFTAKLATDAIENNVRVMVCS